MMHPASCTAWARPSPPPGTDIAAARVSTLGSEAVDVFYLVDRHGDPLDAELAEAVAEAVAEALTESPG